jgi:hypothetical protein
MCGASVAKSENPSSMTVDQHGPCPRLFPGLRFDEPRKDPSGLGSGVPHQLCIGEEAAKSGVSFGPQLIKRLEADRG